jgi:medium-chain acyl-[acyl-carrier-protein] hydrolase
MSERIRDVTVRLDAESPYVRRAARPESRHRLFCFPHAGAGASYYASWAKAFPEEVELIAIQLPGREDRSGEQPFTEVAPLVRTLALALRPHLRGSFSFFGHSGGALLAYELANELQARQRIMPSHLFLSGQAAPDAVVTTRPLHALPDRELIIEIERMGGLDSSFAGDSDLMSVLLPVLRADFALWEKHTFYPKQPLNSSITAIAGQSDERTPEPGLRVWGGHTTEIFRCILLEGGHFYLNGPNEKLLEIIENTIVKNAPRQPEA